MVQQTRAIIICGQKNVMVLFYSKGFNFQNKRGTRILFNGTYTTHLVTIEPEIIVLKLGYLIVRPIRQIQLSTCGIQDFFRLKTFYQKRYNGKFCRKISLSIFNFQLQNAVLAYLGCFTQAIFKLEQFKVCQTNMHFWGVSRERKFIMINEQNKRNQYSIKIVLKSIFKLNPLYSRKSTFRYVHIVFSNTTYFFIVYL